MNPDTMNGTGPNTTTPKAIETVQVEPTINDEVVAVHVAPNETVQETSFSHKCFSCDPGVFVLDPVREAEALREIIKGVEARARDYVAKLKEYNLPIHDKGEVIEDAMLALRHIEDARMRYGKCIQYANTGESNYQK